ncbi:MAG: dolichyl-phosphate beta-glucosyltransferase [Acidobacteriota bacterium]
MTADNIYLSILIPAYNESQRLAGTLDQTLSYLRRQSFHSEILVVDDGSSDHTAAIAEDFVSAASPIELRVVRNDVNRGKGFSVLNGFRHARGEVVLFTDADLSAPIGEADKLLAPLRSCHYDVTLGSRGLKESNIRIRQSLFRESGGKLFNLIVRSIAGLPFRDTQCGFKAFKRDASRWVFDRQSIFDFGFDAEILYLSQKRGLRVLEVPVEWGHSEGTKMRLFSDALKMIGGLFRIRYRDWAGKYD